MTMLQKRPYSCQHVVCEYFFNWVKDQYLQSLRLGSMEIKSYLVNSLQSLLVKATGQSNFTLVSIKLYGDQSEVVLTSFPCDRNAIKGSLSAVGHSMLGKLI